MKLYLLSCLLIVVADGCSPRLSPDSDWGANRWVVIEMKEVPVQQSGSRRDAYVEFFPSEKRFSGNGGCNQINGNYSLEKKSTIRFSEVSSTKMSCPDIAFETTFLSVLSDVNRFDKLDDNLLLKDDNKVLLILQKRPLR